MQKNDLCAVALILDRSAMGILVPLVNSREPAEEAAFAARSPPGGGRSWGAFGACLHQVADFSQWIGAELLLAVQIETKEPVRAAEDILVVD